MDIKDIQNLIKFVAKSGAQEVKLEMEDIKITIKTGSDKPLVEATAIGQHLQTLPQPVQIQAAPVPGSTQEMKEPETTSEEDNFITIKSPIIGTFYRKAAPDKPNFIEVGKAIVEGDVLCVIEAMKLFNEIESEVSGTIVKILVDDASPVEFDQPLFLINPS